VLYDFGCVKRLEPAKVEAYANIVKAAIDDDKEAIVHWMGELGALNPGGPEVPAEVWDLFRYIFIEPILEVEEFDYGSGEIMSRFRENQQTFVKYNRSFQPPPGGVYVDRTVVGIHNILRKLEAQIPCESWTRRFMDLGLSASTRL
jgi:predicted unusual protein kinase regulating ubiquinone biosynthesis (AarF/ABC1/UbiB family)